MLHLSLIHIQMCIRDRSYRSQILRMKPQCLIVTNKEEKIIVVYYGKINTYDNNFTSQNNVLQLVKILQFWGYNRGKIRSLPSQKCDVKNFLYGYICPIFIQSLNDISKNAVLKKDLCFRMVDAHVLGMLQKHLEQVQILLCLVVCWLDMTSPVESYVTKVMVPK